MARTPFHEGVHIPCSTAFNYFCSRSPCLSVPALQVSLTKDLPVQVCYNIADMGFVKYYLAPKVDAVEGASYVPPTPQP